MQNLREALTTCFGLALCSALIGQAWPTGGSHSDAKAPVARYSYSFDRSVTSNSQPRVDEHTSFESILGTDLGVEDESRHHEESARAHHQSLESMLLEPDLEREIYDHSYDGYHGHSHDSNNLGGSQLHGHSGHAIFGGHSGDNFYEQTKKLAQQLDPSVRHDDPIDEYELHSAFRRHSSERETAKSRPWFFSWRS